MNTYVHGGCDCLDNVPSNVPERRLPAPFIPTHRPTAGTGFTGRGDWLGAWCCFLGPLYPPFSSLYIILIKCNYLKCHPTIFVLYFRFSLRTEIGRGKEKENPKKYIQQGDLFGVEGEKKGMIERL